MTARDLTFPLNDDEDLNRILLRIFKHRRDSHFPRVRVWSLDTTIRHIQVVVRHEDDNEDSEDDDDDDASSWHERHW